MVEQDPQQGIVRIAAMIVKAKRVVVFTGAGVSTESGIPDFRSPGGIWTKMDPEDFTIDRFLASPEARNKQWRFFTNGNLFKDARPNAAHEAIAELERLGRLDCVITQNIDNLHQKAGSKNVIEFHGNMLCARCMKCRRKYGYEQVLSDLETRLPPRCECGGILKPDAVFFGEAIPQDALKRSFQEAEDCDLMLVIGTSAQVEPAASLPLIAKGMNSLFRGLGGIPLPKARCSVVEINREPTPLTGRVSDFLIQGSAGEILSLIEKKIRSRKE